MYILKSLIYMYSKIVNPKTDRRVSITGKLGKTILRNYLLVLSGGAASALATEVDSWGGSTLRSMRDDQRWAQMLQHSEDRRDEQEEEEVYGTYGWTLERSSHARKPVKWVLDDYPNESVPYGEEWRFDQSGPGWENVLSGDLFKGIDPPKIDLPEPGYQIPEPIKRFNTV